MAKPRITYLLGAGASYNALPIIDELGKGFKILAEMCQKIDNNGKSHHSSSADFSSSKDTFIAWMNKYSEDAIAFNTIDTYAKKLSLNNQDSELDTLKIALGLFFVIWQEIGNRGELTKGIGRKIEEEVKVLDTRYVSLLSNFLLNKDKIELPANVNFITWNYDIQLERGLKAFVEKPIQEVFEDFRVFPWKENFDKSFPKIVHLNGIAGIYNTTDKKNHLFERGKVPRDTIQTFNDLLFHIDSYKKQSVSNKKQFSYAWEDDEVSQKALEYAEQIMSDTDILVIIGYSFPSFNQEIDKRLFAKFSRGRDSYKIYYQDPNANAISLANKMDLRKDMIVEEKNDMRQFIIPYEYFN
jgi:hypothetical protein